MAAMHSATRLELLQRSNSSALTYKLNKNERHGHLALPLAREKGCKKNYLLLPFVFVVVVVVDEEPDIEPLAAAAGFLW